MSDGRRIVASRFESALMGKVGRGRSQKTIRSVPGATDAFSAGDRLDACEEADEGEADLQLWGGLV